MQITSQATQTQNIKQQLEVSKTQLFFHHSLQRFLGIAFL